MEWQQVYQTLMIITSFTDDAHRFEVNYTVILKSTALVTEFSVKNLNGKKVDDVVISVQDLSFASYCII